MPRTPPKPIPRKPPKPVLRPYWASPDGALKLHHGDCLTVLAQLPDASVDLVFADPPFNIGYEYDEYDDRLPVDEYLQWSTRWLWACVKKLKPTGSMWVAIGPHLQAELKKLLDDCGLHFRNTVVWHYTFGSNQASNFTPSWVALHYYTVATRERTLGYRDGFTWNNGPTDGTRVPSARQLKYKDRRANAHGKLPDNVWVLLPGEHEGRTIMLPHQNVWLGSRVCGTFKERTEHPCQMATSIVERIIKLCTNPGDVVLDPFIGSGTTAVAAVRHGRKCIGVELSQQYLDRDCIPRLEREHEQAIVQAGAR